MSEKIHSESSIVVCEGNGNPHHDEQRGFSSLRRNGLHGCQSRSLRLKFSDNIPGPVYTGLPIQGEDGTLKVALVDGVTGDFVKSCPEASAKLELVVLDENFNFTDDEYWPAEYFSSKVRVGEEGKSLLKGDPNPYVHLEEGVGFVDGVWFKHTREWFKKSKYRLGVRVLVQSNGTRIREAMTEPFFVMDQRMMNKEHRVLVLKDDVWKLKGIGKKGRLCDLLCQEKITTVEQFLTTFHLNREKLREIFEASKSGRKWEETINHALTCQLDETRHLYFSSLEQKDGVVFNNVGKLIGLYQQGQYVPVEDISASGKLVVAAFEHWNDVKTFPDHNSLMQSISRCAITSSEPVKVDCSNEWNCHRSVINENLSTISQSHYMANASTSNHYSMHIMGNSDQTSSQSWCFPWNFPPSPGYLLECQCYQNWNTEDDENNNRYGPGPHVKPNAANNLQSFLAASSGKARKWWKKVSPVFKLLFHKKKSFCSEDAPMAKRRKFC